VQIQISEQTTAAMVKTSLPAGGGSMKHKSIANLIFLGFLAAMTSIQAEEISGAGTPNYIPKFTGPHRVGNSTIFQGSNGNIGIGTTAPLFPLHVFSNNTFPPPGQDFPVTLFVETDASVNSVCAACAIIGIEGLAGAASGNVIGVDGVTFSPDGVGVLGNHPSPTGGGTGVAGLTNSTTGFTVGTSGTALGTTGPGVGVFGQAWSPEGVGGLFANVPGGDIIRGGVKQPEVTVFRVDGTGRVFADGGFQPNGADFAESMVVAGDRATYTAGDLLVIDPTANRRVALAQRPYSTLVAGIYSTKPGLLGTTRGANESAPQNEVPLAVVGIVPCKVTTENGAIQIGDLLVTSSTPGHAMKGTERGRMLGAVVGKALEPLREGQGVVQVLVTLQ
jgi:hypothetical protein